MKPKFSCLRRRGLSLITLALPAFSQALQAAPITWANSGTDFNAGSSWLGGIAPGAVDVATFTGTKITDPVLSAPASVQGLTFSNATASSYAISGSTLTLGIGGINASAVTSGTNTISSNLALAAGQLWSAGSGSTVAVNPVSFSRSVGATLVVQSSGGFTTSTIANTNGLLGTWSAVNSSGSYSYATVSAGNIQSYTAPNVASTAATAWAGIPSSGTGTDGVSNWDITVPGSNAGGLYGGTGLGRSVNTIRYTGAGATRQNSNSTSVGGVNVMTLNGFMNAGGGTFTIGGDPGTTAPTATNGRLNVTIGANLELVLAPMTADIVFNGVIANNGGGASGLTVFGNNSAILAGSSTFTGPTTVNSGTLQVSGSFGAINTTSGITINGDNAKFLHTSSIASTPPISVLNGTLDGTGTLGAVTVADNASAIVANGNGSTTPLTVGSLTFNGDATVNLNRNVSTPLVVSGTLTTTPANGQVVLTVPNPLPNGLVDLVSFGSLVGSASDFTTNLTGLGGRQVAGAPQINGSNIAVNITGESIVWSGVSDDIWETATTGDHTGPNNWVRKSAQTATNFWASDSVEFNDTYNLGSGNIAVTQDYVRIDTGVSPVSTTFTNHTVPYVIDSFGTGIASGSLTKNGTAITTLLGTHTYTGATTINTGTLQLGDGSIDGTIANTSSVTNNGTLLYSWINNHTAPYPISGSGGLLKEGSATLTLTGANTSTGSTTITEGAITVTGGGGLGTGAISVALDAALNLNKTLTLPQTATGSGIITNTAGTATITGDFSGFSGLYRHSSANSSTVLNSTTATSANAAYEITIGNATSQGILSNVTTGDNTFQLGSLSGVVSSLVRNGAAVTGNTTLQIGNLNTDTEFAGTIGGGGGTLGLTKVGTGTLTLSGPATYNGATQINEGTLAFSTTTKALGSSPFTVANGAGLRVKTAAAGSTLLTTASLTLGSSNLTFDLSSLNPTAPQISTGALTVNGSVNLSFLNANSLTTGTYKLIDYTTLSGGGSFPGGSFGVGNRSTATIVNNVVDTSIDLNVSSDTPVWTGLDNGNWIVGPTGPNKNWKLAVAGTATDYLAGDAVLFDDSAAGTTSIVIDTTVNPAGTTFANSTKTYTVSGTAGIASGGLTKSGTGTTTLLTTNTYTGATTINAGTLQLGNGTVDGTIANTSAVTNNGTLAYNWAGNYTAPYAISGNGNLTKAGAGALTITGNNTYTGGTSVNQGTVRIGNNSALGTGAVSIASGATLTNTSLLSGFANNVTGSGAFTAGSGQVTIAGNWSGFSGTVTSMPTGDLVFNGGFSSGVATTTSASAAYVNNHDLNNTNGMIVQNQTGGTVTYKLGSYASAVGSNLRNSGSATGSVIFEIGNLGTDTTAEGTIGGGAQTVSLSKVGSGTLTLAGANTYTGTTVVFSGSLNVTGSLSPASVVTVAGGGKLMGTGTVAGTVIASGTVAPGTSAGTLTTGPASLTGTLAIEIDGATGDKLVSTGTIDISGATLTVTELTGGFTQPSYIIAEGTNITGSFGSVPLGYAVNIIDGGAGKQAILTSTAGGGYAAWAATNAGGGLANQDFDLDGVDNGVEYFMNATAGFTANPAIVGGAVTWPNGGNIPASAYGTQFVVQTSSNLTSWTNVPVGNLTTNTDGPGGSLTYTLPTGQGKLFVRLSVTPN